MKKIIFRILLILILIFGTNDIYAESIGGDNWQRHSNSSRIANFTLTSGMQQDFIINNDKLLINFGNYDTLTGQVNIINKTTNATYTNNVNINWLETCSHSNTIDSGSNYVVTYADGSQATIGGTIYSNFCNQYNETGTVSLTYVDYNFDNNPGVFVSLRNTTDTFEIPCDFNGNTFKCKKYQYSEFDMLRIRIMAKGQTSQYLVSLNNTFSLTNDTNNAIINNNNTNTQQITNSINGLDNTINNSSISSSTNTDNLITLPNSNGKNTILDLLMVPINFITSIVNSFSNSCVSYNLGNLLGTDIILPCINLSNILGSTFYNIIDAIFAFGMLFAFIRAVKRFIQKSLLLASDFNSEVKIL